MPGSSPFYAPRPDKYLYAPLELVTGRLFAVPRFLNLGSSHRDIESPRAPGNVPLRGGVDAPVTGQHGKQLLAGAMTIEGGTDVPVVSGIKAAVWAVGSSGDCRHMILVVPARDLKSVLVFRFTNGLIELLQRVAIPAQINYRFGADTAASYLPLVCN